MQILSEKQYRIISNKHFCYVELLSQFRANYTLIKIEIYWEKYFFSIEEIRITERPYLNIEKLLIPHKYLNKRVN
ncbi:hypothetical protein BpHYR1_044522 [Brachionus plicatilis]|uniref:Uncharacterized protein n=1 Tax=Brachionus plicatilis TaxID=10195 RepID=A0A3M7SZB4_BRAPC|nr:hypothetical protein BpHYR1_044522 [Brachionus plicatilis]